MDTSISELDIAHADFWLVHEEDPKRAIQWINLLFCDPSLIAKRSAFLLAAAGDQPNETPYTWTKAIDLIGEFGVLLALDEGKLTFDEVESITWNVDALTRVHEAMMAIPEFDPAEWEQAKPVDFSEIISQLVSVTPDQRGVRHLPEHNVRMYECDWQFGVAGGSEDEDFSFERYPKHISPDGTFYANVSDDDMQNGLCRISLFVDEYCTQLIAEDLVEAVLEDDGWVIRVGIHQLFEDDVPEVEKLYVCLTFAGTDNFAMFSTDKVRKFVDSLEEGDQAKRASVYLRQGGKQ